MKCSGEMSGCQRCRARRRSCHYESSAAGNGNAADRNPGGMYDVTASAGSATADESLIDLNFDAPDNMHQYSASEEPFFRMTSESVDVTSSEDVDCFWDRSRFSSPLPSLPQTTLEQDPVLLTRNCGTGAVCPSLTAQSAFFPADSLWSSASSSMCSSFDRSVAEVCHDGKFADSGDK